MQARQQLLHKAGAVLLLLRRRCRRCKGCRQARYAVSEGPAAGHGLQRSVEVAGVAQVCQASDGKRGWSIIFFEAGHGVGCVAGCL